MFDPKTRILIVDDFLFLRTTLRTTLGMLGFTDILEAEDGRKAWDVLSNANPPVGLVLSDWNMPGSSGVDLLKRVRSESRFAKLPFVLVTTESERGAILEAAEAGVSNYIVKPYSVETVKTKLEAVYQKLAGG